MSRRSLFCRRSKALPQPAAGRGYLREDGRDRVDRTVIKAEDDKMARRTARQPLHPYIGKPTLLIKILPNKKKTEEATMFQ
jgi:hypothetical protein